MHPIDKTFGGVHTGTVHGAGPEHPPVRFRNYRPGQPLPKLQAIPAVEESFFLHAFFFPPPLFPAAGVSLGQHTARQQPLWLAAASQFCPAAGCQAAAPRPPKGLPTGPPRHPARGANAGTYWAHYTTFSTWQEPERLQISNCCRHGFHDTSNNMYNSQATAFTCMSCFLHTRTPLKGWSLQRSRLITFSMKLSVKRLPKLLQVQCPSVFKTRLLLRGMKPELPSKA